MTVSSGFFNSVNHDRLYDAEQMSSIFDGIIEDGVYESIGEAFMVTAYANANDTVIVGTGRAWFDHTWTLNDTQFSINLPAPSLLLNRIDMIVIDVDRRDNVRNNSIILVSGEYAESPVAPTLINEELHKQYPIAKINMSAGESGPISQSKITYLVGTEQCPLVTAPLEALNISNYVAQLNTEFNEWFDGIKDIFDEDIAGNLQLQIDDMQKDIDDLKTKSIDPELFEKVSNITSSMETLGSSSNFHTFLPDGYVLSVGVYNDSNLGNSLSDTGSSKVVYASIKSLDGVYVTKVQLMTFAQDYYDVRFFPNGICAASVTPMKVDIDAYPVTVYCAVPETAKSSDNKIRMECKLYKLEISSEHVITQSIQSYIAGDGTNFSFSSGITNYPPISSPEPVISSDGSSTFVMGVTGSSSSSYPACFRFSNEMVLVNKNIMLKPSGVMQGSYGPAPYMYSFGVSGNTTSFYIIPRSSSALTNTSSEFVCNPNFSDYVIPMESNTGQIKNITAIPISNIVANGTLIKVASDGKHLMNNSGSYILSQTSDTISPFIEVGRTLGATVDPGSLVSSIVDPNKDILIAIYQNGVKISPLIENGLTMFSDPSTISTPTDSEINSLMIRSNSWYISDDGKTVKCILPCSVVIIDSSYKLPVQVFNPTSYCKMLTIKLGGQNV